MISRVLVFLALLLIYLYFENKNSFKIATIFKVLVSFYIAFLSWSFVLTKNNSFFTIMISVGLSFAVFADYFLQFIKSNAQKYRIGICFFALMHLCLLIAYYSSFSFSYLDLIILVVILLILFALQTSEKWDLGKEKVFLSIYTFFVALMAAKAMSLAITNPQTYTILIGLGGFLFIISDFILGIWDYYDNNEKLVLANRIVYFIGQLLFACSVFYL